MCRTWDIDAWTSVQAGVALQENIFVHFRTLEIITPHMPASVIRGAELIIATTFGETSA